MIRMGLDKRIHTTEDCATVKKNKEEERQSKEQSLQSISFCHLTQEIRIYIFILFWKHMHKAVQKQAKTMVNLGGGYGNRADGRVTGWRICIVFLLYLLARWTV